MTDRGHSFLGPSLGSGSVTASSFTNAQFEEFFMPKTGGPPAPDITSDNNNQDTCSVTSTGECRSPVQKSAHTAPVDDSIPQDKTFGTRGMFTPLASSKRPPVQAEPVTPEQIKKPKSKLYSRNRSGAPTAPVMNPPPEEEDKEDDDTDTQNETSETSDDDNKSVQLKTKGRLDTCATADTVRVSVNDGVWKVLKMSLLIGLGVAGLLYVFYTRMCSHISVIMQEFADRNAISLAELNLGPINDLCKGPDCKSSLPTNPIAG